VFVLNVASGQPEGSRLGCVAPSVTQSGESQRVNKKYSHRWVTNDMLTDFEALRMTSILKGYVEDGEQRNVGHRRLIGNFGTNRRRGHPWSGSGIFPHLVSLTSVVCCIVSTLTTAHLGPRYVRFICLRLQHYKPIENGRPSRIVNELAKSIIVSACVNRDPMAHFTGLISPIYIFNPLIRFPWMESHATSCVTNLG